jgi:hypothetical protein
LNDPAAEADAVPADDDFTDIDLAGIDDDTATGLDDGAPVAAATERAPGPAPEPASVSVAPVGSVAAAGTEHLDEARAIAAELQTYSDELTQLDTAELSEHVEYYQRAHGHLQRALTDIDHA